MTRPQHPLELLAPAKNADFGIEAIKHGADAVYIGGPAFGARYGAGNEVAEIRRLCDFAHRYRAKVFVALNTILHDDELEGGRQLAWELYDAGADALIIQDMGLLELDLPPIQLHASTQTDNRNPAKVKLPRRCRLLAGRPGARTESQRSPRHCLANHCRPRILRSWRALCRLQRPVLHQPRPYRAQRQPRRVFAGLPPALHAGRRQGQNDHREPAPAVDEGQQPDRQHPGAGEAGVSSFKIEGRLKDLSYVKNITAHYRTLLDDVIAEHPEFSRASSGRSTYHLHPQPDKTFNRGYTDYFANDRQDDIGAFDSPAFVGELIGEVAEIGDGWFTVATEQAFHNGDGVCFHDATAKSLGMRINRVDGARSVPGRDAGSTDRRRHPLPQP
jgi:collagenase-like PrtC family protease